MNTEALCPLATGNLADGVVDLACLFIGQALVLHMAFQAKASSMSLLLAASRPFKIAGSVI